MAISSKRLKCSLEPMDKHTSLGKRLTSPSSKWLSLKLKSSIAILKKPGTTSNLAILLLIKFNPKLNQKNPSRLLRSNNLQKVEKMRIFYLGSVFVAIVSPKSSLTRGSRWPLSSMSLK
jgi:hypothetical protein